MTFGREVRTESVTTFVLGRRIAVARCDLAANRASEMAGTRKAGGKKGGKRKHGATHKGGKKRPSGGDMGPALAGGQRLSGASKYLEDVMVVFRGLPGRPMNARQVASTMGISDKDIQEMLHVLMRQEAGKGKLKEEHFLEWDDRHHLGCRPPLCLIAGLAWHADS